MEYYLIQIHENLSLLEWFKHMKVSKNKYNYLIDNNLCYSNEKVLTRNSILKNGDYLYIDLSKYSDRIVKKCKYDFEVLYEDNYLLVINKPLGYVIYDENPSKITITDMVNSYLLDKGEMTMAYAAHRLDIETTGCLVYCKDMITLAYVSAQFEEKNIQKEYLAVVEGITESNGMINAPIGNNRHLNNTMIVSKTGKPALTKFETICHNKNISLVRVTIKTGRTHQIRVHLAYINHPIIGDIKYGSKIKASRIMLHCYKVLFCHPESNNIISIVSNMPNEMNKLVY